MGERTDQLRSDIDRQREQLAGTVGQIENRVSPSRVFARRRYRVRRRLVDARDRVMGNDQPYYSWEASDDRDHRGGGAAGARRDGSDESDASLSERAKESADSAREAVADAPDRARRKTRGSPLAVGLMAFGAGLLTAALLPESERERRAVHEFEPELEEAISTGADEAREAARQMKQPAREAGEELRETGTEAAKRIKDSSAGSG